MFIINRFLGRASSLESLSSQQNKINDRENSTLLKIAACIPVIGLVIGQTETRSLKEKLKELPLPKDLRPSPRLGNILDENASSEEIKTVCKRAIQLNSIVRDYTKAGLVNNILTIALAVYALAMDVIPLSVASILISGFSLTSAMLIFVLCTDRSIKRYEKIGAASASPG